MQRAVKAQLQMQLIQLIQKSPPVLVVLHAKPDDKMQVNPLWLFLDWEPEQGNCMLVERDYCNVAKMQLCGMKGRTGEHSVDINSILPSPFPLKLDQSSSSFIFWFLVYQHASSHSHLSSELQDIQWFSPGYRCHYANWSQWRCLPYCADYKIMTREVR